MYFSFVLSKIIIEEVDFFFRSLLTSIVVYFLEFRGIMFYMIRRNMIVFGYEYCEGVIEI